MICEIAGGKNASEYNGQLSAQLPVYSKVWWKKVIFGDLPIIYDSDNIIIPYHIISYNI